MDPRWISEERDRRLIQDSICRYFWGLDRGDADLRNTAFAPGGKLFVEGVQILGPGAVPPEARKPPEGVPPADAVLGFTHCLHQCDIRLDGDVARAETYATAYIVVEVAAGRTMLVRGLRYHDRLARREDAWLIEERHHQVDWMFEQPARIGHPLSERATFADFLAAG